MPKKKSGTVSSTTPADIRAVLALPPDKLRNECNPETFAFTTTADLQPGENLLGQQRAAEALGFAIGMTGHGYNVYVAGENGSGKMTAVRCFLEELAVTQRTPSDWCYVHNFREPGRPRALRLPPGQGRQLRTELQKLVTAARREIPRAFESEEYLGRREQIVNELNRLREEGLANLTAEAQSNGLLLQLTPMGFMIAPVIGNRPIPNEELATLRPEMRQEFEEKRARLEPRIQTFLKEMRSVERLTREKLDAQDREVAMNAVGGLVEDLTEDYADQPDISHYLAEVREGILSDITLFRSHPMTPDALPKSPDSVDPQQAIQERAFRKYEVNVVIDHSSNHGAPVISESNPTYPNLIGRVEREAVFGALLTDFSLITPGALHRANGGYLLIRVLDLLRVPMAWEGLKRALRDRAIDIEDAGEALGIVGTRGLRPDPIPLDCRVFLIGEAEHYFLLYQLDPDFRGLFKVRADFEPDLSRTPENELAYARFIRSCTGPAGPAFDRTAVAQVIEESSRLVSDQQKLSGRYQVVADLVEESSHFASQAKSSVVTAAHVRTALEQRRRRASLVPERFRDAVTRGIILIKPEGRVTGAINGLAVVGGGDVMFGHPSRITATVAAGPDGVVDIERQVEMGGPIHSKGVMILGGFLMDRFAQRLPMALSARLVFEQSYSGIEGDSASLAELLVLLSQLSTLPIDQGIAVTGSVNQHGEVQAIGGAHLKIEGFFDVCQAGGLTGSQGVILPASNIQHLMLREDVIDAVAAGTFHIWGVTRVEEAVEILTGVAAGERGDDGEYPADSVYGLVEARLEELASTLRDFAAPTEPVKATAKKKRAAKPAPKPAK